MLGAWFMATDYVTSPITVKGQYVYGVCLGVLTGILRIFGASAEGVSYAIIFCNLLVPQIERFTRPVAFGKGRRKEMKKQDRERYPCADCDHTDFRPASWCCQ